MLRTQKKRSSNKVHGISPETGRESMVGKICERGIGLEPGVKERWSYGWREWWVDRVIKCGRSVNREVRQTERVE